MTIEQIYKKEYGEKEWTKVSPRLKKLFLKIDSLPLAQKRITKKQLEKALS